MKLSFSKQVGPLIVCATALALMVGRDQVLAQDLSTPDGPVQSSTDIARAHPIGNEDILKMAKAGLADDVLLQTIALKPGHYDTSTDDLIALKQAGVSDRIISAMQAHGTGLALRPDPAKISPTPVAPGIDDIGVYYQDKSGLWQPMHLERVVFKSAGEVKHLLTHGIIARDMNGYVDGPHSPLPMKAGMTILIYTPVGTEGAEYSFLQFREKPDHREFRVLYGGVFHSESGTRRDEITYTPVKIAPRMYTFTVPADVVKGEYGVLPPGAANQRGLADSGKIYTFSVTE